MFGPTPQIWQLAKQEAKVLAEKEAKELAEREAKQATEQAAKKAEKETAEKAEKDAASSGGKGEGNEGGKVKGSPCDHLKQGSGKGSYRGGARSKTSKSVNDGKDSHHTPASMMRALSSKRMVRPFKWTL